MFFVNSKAFMKNKLKKSFRDENILIEKRKKNINHLKHKYVFKQIRGNIVAVLKTSFCREIDSVQIELKIKKNSCKTFLWFLTEHANSKLSKTTNYFSVP